MKPRRIVIFTGKFDLDSDAVILRLREIGQLPARVNLEDLLAEGGLTLRLGAPSAEGTLSTRNRRLDLSAIGAVLWRAGDRPASRPDLGVDGADFAQSELGQALDGAWVGLDCHWMSHPDRIRCARWRPGQLARAVQAGFDIPPTLVTSQPERIPPFFERCAGRVTFETMATSGPAAAISEGGLQEHLRRVAGAPGLFQENVPLRRRIRATVIGDEVFAAEAEAGDAGQIDLLPEDAPMRMQPLRLPGEIEARCLCLTRNLGLDCCALDLGLAEDGRHLFLGCNPAGRIRFVERRAPELKMIDALAARLLRGAAGELRDRAPAGTAAA